jgi:thiamine-monophosphate kinase
LIISTAIFGEADEDEIVYSEMYKPDLLVVTGDIVQYTWVYSFRNVKTSVSGKSKLQPDLDAYTPLIERQLKPEARKMSVILCSMLSK